MKTLSKHWWKLLVIVLLAVATRVLVLQIFPLSPTFELPLSIISQSIGMIPTAALVIAFSYLVVVAVLSLVQEDLNGTKIKKALVCGSSFSLFWFVGVLETVAALGKPLLPEIVVGIADIIPVAIIGILVCVWISSETHKQQEISLLHNFLNILIITFSYVAGRYFLYAVIHVNSGYTARPDSTFFWTLAMGSAIGVLYSFLRSGLKGNKPFLNALYFGGIVFGIIWTLFNFFMPIVFDMSFINFEPTLLNYVWRVSVDMLFVITGVWVAELFGVEQIRAFGRVSI